MSSLLYEHGKRLDNSVFADTIINKKDYESIISENMDLTDMQTLATVNAINEADRAAVLTSLTSRLYDNIVDKVDDIDFGTIATSKGDITKIENYERLLDCIEVLRSIVKEYHQSTEPIDVVSDAITNIRNRTKLWTKCYAMNLELPIILYQTMTMACVSSISLLIATSIEFIKNSEDGTYTAALDKVAYNKTSVNLLYSNLKKFNNACKSGEIDEVVNHIISTNSKQFVGAVCNILVSGAAVVAIIKFIVPMLRELVYFFYSAKQSVSDYFAIQADLLEVNANNVQYKSDIPDEKRTIIYNRQKGIADKFRNISNTFAIKMNKAQHDADKSITSEKKKYKISDITYEKLDSDDSYGLF
jgi:hypothetical protein